MKNSFACVLASQIYRASKNTETPSTWAECMSWAWLMVKHTAQNFTLVEFTKNDGTVCRRVVSEDLSYYIEFKGTGRPLKEGQVIFVDLGKYVVTGENFIISTYTNRITRREKLAA